MSLVVPTTQTVSDNIVGQIESSISQTVPLLPKTFVRVLAKVLAGVVVILYKYGGFIFLQLFVSTASLDETVVNGKTIRPLVEWGRLIGVGDPNPATRAELLVTITVTSLVGQLPAGSQLLRSDTGIVYQTTTVVALDATSKTVTVRATSDQDGNGGVGSIGNLVAGDIIQFANALPNVQTNAVVASTSLAGADAETSDAYRARILQRFQARPQGGAYADYAAWALDVPGIVHVYPYKSDSPGEIDVYVEADPASSGSPDGIPTGPQLTAVLDAINLDVAGVATRRPVNAAVNTLPITRTPVDVVISGLDVIDPLAAQAAIAEGLDEYLRSREPFIVGLSVLPRDDRITVAALGGIVDGIVSAEGGTVTRLDISVAGSPITALTLGNGEKAKLGARSYV